MEHYKFACGCQIPIIENTIKKDGLPHLDIPYNDLVIDLNYGKSCPETWKMIGKGKTKGVFQLESDLGNEWAIETKPKDLAEIAALISIIRPGTLKSHDKRGKTLTRVYADRKMGREENIPEIEAVGEILKDTYNILVYQEQAIKIVQEIGGFSEEESDKLRKAIGKKDAALMKKIKEAFKKGCIKTKKVSEKEAITIFDWIQESQRYAFNLCVSGDTLIKKGAKGSANFNPTVEEMYNIRNDINYAKSTGHISLYKKWKQNNNYGKGWSLCEDERIRVNTIVDIRFVGIKSIYKITTESGKTIKVTNNHKFPTKNGEKRLNDLKIGDELYICGNYEKNNKVYKYSKFTTDAIEYNNYEGQGFPKGNKNPSYTNGAYSKYKNNIKLLPNACNHCGKKSDRLECHHIDKNRENSDISNLEKLCVSCYKKADYKLGRVKRGEKGYPSYFEKIKSIDYVKKDRVYDVEMANPNHNFVVDSGIVTSNSHAVEYGSIGYLTAFTKYHFPLHFFAAWIKRSRGKQDTFERIRELAEEAKSFNINVLLPTLKTLNYNNNDVCIDEGNIRFGLNSIKGLGQSSIDKINNIVDKAKEDLKKDLKDFSWYDFLYNIAPNIGSDASKALITGGVLTYRKPRSEMLYEYEKIKLLTNRQINILKEYSDLHLTDALDKLKEKVDKRQKEKIDTIKKLLLQNDIKSDRPSWVITEERELYGVPITYNPIEILRTVESDTTCKEFLDGKTGNMSINGEIIQIQSFKIKNGDNKGKKMAKGKLHDGKHTAPIVIFSKEFEEYGNELFKGNCVVIEGFKDPDKKSFKDLVVRKVKTIY